LGLSEAHNLFWMVRTQVVLVCAAVAHVIAESLHVTDKQVGRTDGRGCCFVMSVRLLAYSLVLDKDRADRRYAPVQSVSDYGVELHGINSNIVLELIPCTVFVFRIRSNSESRSNAP